MCVYINIHSQINQLLIYKQLITAASPGTPPRTGHPSMAGHTHTYHTHSDGDNSDLPANLTCMYVRCGRKPEFLEKTPIDMGRTYKPYTDSGPGQKLFFLLINVTTKRWNKITLFEDLLYSDFLSVEDAIKQTSKQTTKKLQFF